MDNFEGKKDINHSLRFRVVKWIPNLQSSNLGFKLHYHKKNKKNRRASVAAPNTARAENPTE